MQGPKRAGGSEFQKHLKSRPDWLKKSFDDPVPYTGPRVLEVSIPRDRKDAIKMCFSEPYVESEDPEYSRNLRTLLDLVSKNLPNLSLEDQYKMFCDAADWCGSELAWRQGDRSK